MADLTNNTDPNWTERKEMVDKDKTPEPEVQGEEPAKEPEKQEPAKTPEKQEPVTPEKEEESQFNVVDYFDKNLGIKVDSEEKIKSSFTELEKLRSEAKSRKELEALTSKYEQELLEVHDKLDPKKIYGGEEGLKYKLIMDKAKGKSAAYKSVLTKIAGTDINSLSEMDAATLGMLHDAPTLKENHIKAALYEDIGVNIDKLRDEATEEGKKFNINDIALTEAQQARLALKASAYKEKLSALKEVDIPEYKGYKETIEARKTEKEAQTKSLVEKWADRPESLVDDFKIEYKSSDKEGNETVYSFDVDADFKKKIPEMVKSEVALKGIEPTKENIEAIKSELEDVYWSKKANRVKILNKFRSDIEARLEEYHHNDKHTDRPISKEKAPEGEHSEEDAELESTLNKWQKGGTDLNNIF